MMKDKTQKKWYTASIALLRQSRFSDQSKKLVPSLLRRVRNSSRSIPATGPGLPLPISLPSTEITGISSAPVPVRKHSSAI